MKEEWKEIPNTDKRYEISNKGRVRRINDFVDPFILKHQVTWRGYPCVSFRIMGKKHLKVIHRLVAMAFVDGYKNYLQVNHRDGVKTNNIYTNLEWVSPEQNREHAVITGLINMKGENNINNKFKKVHILAIRSLQGMRTDKIASLFGTSRSYVNQIFRREVWKHISKPIS